MEAQHAPLVIQALQAPLSEISATEHLHAESSGGYRDVKHWYALTCSASSFRTILVSDALVRELSITPRDESGYVNVPTERPILVPHNARKIDPAIQSVVAAVQDMMARDVNHDGSDQAGQGPTSTHQGPIRAVRTDELVPIVGWLNVPVPIHDTAGPSNNRLEDATAPTVHTLHTAGPGEDDPWIGPADDGVCGPARTATRDEQRAWVDALDAWEEETAATLQASLDRTAGQRPAPDAGNDPLTPRTKP